MAYPRVNMELGGYVQTAQSKIEFGQALRDVGPVVPSAGEKRARGLCREPGVMGNGWIQKRLKIRLGTRSLNKIL
jgi:hypothetical protein